MVFFIRCGVGRQNDRVDEAKAQHQYKNKAVQRYFAAEAGIHGKGRQQRRAARAHPARAEKKRRGVAAQQIQERHQPARRVSAEEEVLGLDATEHNLPSAYADFMPAGNMFYSAGTSVETLKGNVPMDKAVEVTNVSKTSAPKPAAFKENKAEEKTETAKLTKVSIICKQSKFEELKESLNNIGVNGLTVTQVLGCGTQKGMTTKYRGAELDVVLLPKMKVEVVVSAVPVEEVIETAKKALYTGNIGDGKIFVYDVENVVKVRTGDSGFDALQSDDEL